MSTATDVVDYSVQVDGNDQAVANVAAGITITLKVKRPAAAANRGKPDAYRCRYFNKQQKRWTADGVTFVSFDAATSELVCRTEHLSVFSGFGNQDEAAPATTAATPAGPPVTTAGATTAAPSGDSTPSPAGTTASGGGGAAADDDAARDELALIIACSVAGAFAVALAGVLAVRHQRSQSAAAAACEADQPLTNMGRALESTPPSPPIREAAHTSEATKDHVYNVL